MWISLAHVMPTIVISCRSAHVSADERNSNLTDWEVRGWRANKSKVRWRSQKRVGRAVRWHGDGCISCFEKGFWVTGALADPNAVVPQGEWSVQELKDEGCLMVHNAGVTSLSIEMGETLAYGLSEEDESAGSALQVEADPGMDADETDELSPGSCSAVPSAKLETSDPSPISFCLGGDLPIRKKELVGGPKSNEIIASQSSVTPMVV